LRRNIVCGIDVGNSAVKTIIAELNRDNLRPHILGVGSVESTGLRRGTVVDMEEEVKNIGASLERAQSMAGVKVSQAYVSLNGLHIRTQESRGVVAVARADSEIMQSDVDRVVDAASVISLPQNREVIHVIPRNFIIDGQEHVKNPVGMKGVRLEADVMIIDGLSTYIRNLAKCINANDIEVLEFVYSPLALARSALNKHQREHGVLSLDLGGGFSTMSIFHEGEIVYTGVIPIGSRHITNDLAIALRSPMDIAEEIKKDSGFISDSVIPKKDTIDLSDIMQEEGFIVPKKHIAEVINARTAEIFEKVDKELKNSGHNLLPAGLVLSGGGANLHGLSDYAKHKMKLAVRVGGDYFLEGISDKVTDPSFAVAVGLIVWGMEKEARGGSYKGKFSIGGPLKKFGDWLKNFAP